MEWEKNTQHNCSVQKCTFLLWKRSIDSKKEVFLFLLCEHCVDVCFFISKLPMELLLLFDWHMAMFPSDTKSDTASFLLSYFMAALSLNHAHLIWCLNYCWWVQDRLEVFRSIKKSHSRSTELLDFEWPSQSQYRYDDTGFQWPPMGR